MYKYVFFFSCSLVTFQPAWADEDIGITVTATGLPQDVDETGQAVTIIGRDEIETIQGPDITRVLNRLPGVTLTRNGQLGGFTGVRVRGAASEALLVLVDGVRMTDVASPAGGFDFGNLATGGVESVELLRGSNSVIWGSDAVGGVINVTTRVESGLAATIEYGGEHQFTADASAGHVTETYSVGLNAGYIHTRGFSSAASGTENDGFEQFHISGQGKVTVAPGLSLVANGRYAEGKLEIDGYPPPFYSFADTLERQDTRQLSGRIGAEYASDLLDLRAGFAMSDTERDLIDEAVAGSPYYTTDGHSERAELLGRIKLPSDIRLDFGADKEWTRFRTQDLSMWAIPPGITRGKADIASGHALLGYYGDRLTLAAGARIDDHSQFGHEWTFGANGAFAVTERLRLRASYGEGFKAPSLYQLLSPDYGNPALTPERSKAYDAGLEYRSNNVQAAFSVFRRDTNDLIDFVYCTSTNAGACGTVPFAFGTYLNVGKARAEGVEAELHVTLAPNLGVQAAYSYVKSTDRTPGSLTRGNDLARRPREALTLSLDWANPQGFKLGADLRVVGRSYDDPANTVRLGGYAVADIRASAPLNEHVEIFGRVENVADEDYETTAGYNTQGRAAFIGARLRM